MVVVKDSQPGAEPNFEKRKICMFYIGHSLVFYKAMDPSSDWDMCLENESDGENSSSSDVYTMSNFTFPFTYTFAFVQCE